MLSYPQFILYIIVSFLVFGILFILLFCALFMVHWNTNIRQRSSLAYLYFIRISGLSAILLRNVFYLPIITILFSTISCSTDQTLQTIVNAGYLCYSQAQIFLVICSLLVILLLTIICIIVSLLYCEEEPDSKIPWACASRLVMVLKVLRKLCISLTLFIANDNYNFGLVVIICLLILSTIIMWLLSAQAYMQDKNILYAVFTIEGLIWWFNFASLLYVSYEVDISNPIILILVNIILFAVIILKYREKCIRLLQMKSLHKFTNADDVEVFCRVLIDTLQAQKENQDLVIEGIILLHITLCDNRNCNCKVLAAAEVDELGCAIEANQESDECSSPVKKQINKRSTANALRKLIPQDQNLDEERQGPEKKKLAVMRMIISDVSKWREKQAKTPRLCFYIGYLKMACFKNKLAALYEIMLAEEENPEFYERILAYRLL